MITRIISHGSAEYEQMLQLRIRALLEPIGIPAEYINSENEKNDIFIAAFDDNEMVGCCVLSPKDNQVVQLRQMAVREDYQGKGIGSVIISYAEQVAARQNFQTLMMHARDPVIGFYEKCGYQIAGEQFFEVGMGHHRMEKMLS